MNMWPLLLDMTKEESIQYLRNLELEAYSQLVSALRAQGPLNSDKRKLLKDTGSLLNITQERHKAEVRRAINDEKLNTVAYHITGHTASSEDWAQEGKRLTPILPRTAPQTAFSAIADEVAENAFQCNKQLPLPCSTERKRPAPSQINSTMLENNKNIPFRIPDPPKVEDTKKRKLNMNPENSSLAQHLLSPKFCRIQQLYRQRSKPKQKEIHKKTEHEQIGILPQHRIVQSMPHQSNVCLPQTLPQQHQQQQHQQQHQAQKVTVLQNISLQPIKEECPEHEDDTVNDVKPPDQTSHVQICANENQAPRPKILPNLKPNSSITIKPAPLQIPGTSSENQKIKVCTAKKTITKTVNSGQKLIVVSNAQTLTSNSILQRTLQIPFVKNVSIKNFDKFKIVTTNPSPTSFQVTNVTNSAVNPIKHKVVTVKTNPITKKVIPLSQLQVLNSKGSIKVLPIGSKIVGKTTVGTTSSPLYIMNATQLTTKINSSSPQFNTTNKINIVEEAKPAKNADSNDTEQNVIVEDIGNGKSTVLADILKASGVITEAEDYDAKIEEFHIPQNKNRLEENVDDRGTAKINVEESELELEKTEEPSQEYKTMNINVDDTQNPVITTREEYATTDVITKNMVETEPELTEIETEQEMTHDDIIGHHDFNEVTINSEEVIPHVMLQVDCSEDKLSDIADDN